MDFSFIVVYICLTYIMNKSFIVCKLTGKNTRRLILCKNKEKFQLENLVSANE